MTDVLDAPPRAKFADPAVTLDGSTRATVAFDGMKTLWFNTGTLCNIACVNCYIESSPKNDQLVYLTVADVAPFLDELDADGPIEIGFTGGEPFMAPEIVPILEATLARGHRVLVLTNAMQPMMRPRVRDGLAALAAAHGDRLRLRVSLDHYAAALHDEERGDGSFAAAMDGLRWIKDAGIPVALAGRTVWGEPDAHSRAGYAALIADLGLAIDVDDPTQLVLFPEMRVDDDPPEITTACWDILGKNPSDIMCANQRMVVRRRGAERASVLACTLIPYDKRFDLGETLAEATASPVSLNHKYCASFCVLGGGNCST